MLNKTKCLYVAVGLWLTATLTSAALTFNNSYYSFRNKERAFRKSTTLIILHTTEAPSRSALNKLRDMGESHFCVDESGRIYRIIDHRRIAFHAGRSMWNGRVEVDNFAIGIEVCGYHDKPINAAQIEAVKNLVAEMQRIYKISDANVLAHAHVAYGAPNKWQKKTHRGRKRCGMLFATKSMRLKLGLDSRPSRDPDVTARRLVVGDDYLARVLYGAASSSTVAIAPFPNFSKPGRTKSASPYQIIGIHGRTAQEIAGASALKVSTLYIYPDGQYTRGSLLGPDAVLRLPYGTKVLQNYYVGGPVLSKRPVASICGNRWNQPDTFYLISGSLVAGNTIDGTKIPSGSMVFYRD